MYCVGISSLCYGTIRVTVVIFRACSKCTTIYVVSMGIGVTRGEIYALTLSWLSFCLITIAKCERFPNELFSVNKECTGGCSSMFVMHTHSVNFICILTTRPAVYWLTNNFIHTPHIRFFFFFVLTFVFHCVCAKLHSSTNPPEDARTHLCLVWWFCIERWASKHLLVTVETMWFYFHPNNTIEMQKIEHSSWC